MGPGQKIDTALSWMINHVNTDGGFGDTPESTSNVSTSLLCYAAIHFCESEQISGRVIQDRLEKYLLTQKIYIPSSFDIV